jgi:hypothetical protein
MKKFIVDVQNGWKELPNSVKFWNGLVLLGLIIVGIIDVDILMIVWGIMSILAFAGFFDSLGGDEKFIERNLWVWFTPLTWGVMLLGLLIMGCMKLKEKTIDKFNNWLNKK